MIYQLIKKIFAAILEFNNHWTIPCVLCGVIYSLVLCVPLCMWVHFGKICINVSWLSKYLFVCLFDKVRVATVFAPAHSLKGNMTSALDKIPFHKSMLFLSELLLLSSFTPCLKDPQLKWTADLCSTPCLLSLHLFRSKSWNAKANRRKDKWN